MADEKKLFVDEFVDIISNYSDTPNVYAKAGAYHILSSCIGRFIEMPDFKVSRPNTWFILSSIPGRMRRSTIIRYVQAVTHHSLLEYYKAYKQLKKMECSDEEIKQRVYSNAIDDGNAPGIADAIIFGNNIGINAFEITCPEIGDLIRKIVNPSSTTVNVDNLLSRLYYGESFSQKLSTRGEGRPRFIPEGQYVTMYSGMQEPEHYLKEGISRQGLLRRIKIIYVKSKDLDMKNWKSPHKKGYKNIWDELKDFANKRVVPLMLDYSKNDLTEVHQTENVNSYIEKKARERDEALIEEETDYNIYQQTQWEYEIKLAVLDAVSNGITTVDMKNIDNIEDFLEKSSCHIKGVIDDLGLSSSQILDEKREQRILDIISKYGFEGATSSNIQTGISSYKKLKLPAKELNEKLIDMFLRNIIFQRITKDSCNREKITWCLNKYKDYKL